MEKNLTLLTLTKILAIFAILFFAAGMSANAQGNGQGQGQGDDSKMIEICHYEEIENQGLGWKVIPINGNAWGTHQSHGDGEVSDFKIESVDDEEKCQALIDAQNEQELDPPVVDDEPVFSLEVCKILLDEDGEVIIGDDIDAEFSIEITKPDQTKQTITFETPLGLTDDIVNDNDGSLDAQCEVIDNLVAGEYKYAEEDISNGDYTWENPLYHDYFTGVPESLSDFSEFTIDGSDDDDDDTDGVMNLSKNNQRKLVVVNQLATRPDDPTLQQCNLTLVSDTNDFVEETNDFAKLLSWGHPQWTATIGSASWIWGHDPVVDPVVETTQTFVKQFNWAGGSASSTLEVAADNSYIVELNGSIILDDDDENNHTESTKDSTTGFSINPGFNELKIEVKNWAQANGTVESNPAGLKYQLSIDGENENGICGEEIPVVPELPENICLIPNAMGETDYVNLGDPGKEKSVQEILDEHYTDLDEYDDQVQIENWSCSADNLTLEVKFLEKLSNHGKVFGYYTDTDEDSFEPIFRAGNTSPGDSDVTIGTIGGTYIVPNIDATEFSTLGFAIKSWTGSKNNFWATENSLNGGADKVATYNPEGDTYVLAFDDILNKWVDFNDLVVEVKSTCTDDPQDPDLPKVTQFFLVDANSNNDFIEITEGLVININGTTLDLDAVNIRAVTEGTLESVIFELDANPDVTENIPPYAIFGDDGATDYNPGSISLGAHTLTATPYTQDNGGGDAGTALTVNFEIVDEEAVIETAIAATNSGGGGSTGGYRRNLPRATQGEVLGATTDAGVCGMYLHTYMRQDFQNDSWEVRKLQAFLNTKGYLVPVTGVFDSQTDQAVRNFQADLNIRILVPWQLIGMNDGETPTGYVYKTTRHTINNIVCPGSEPFPILP